MMELGRFQQPAMARLCAEVLRERGLVVELREQAGTWLLLLPDPSRYQEARDLLQAFQSNPLAPEFQRAAWRTGIGAGVRAGTAGSVWRGWWAELGPVVKIVLVACVLVFLSPWVVGEQWYRALLFAPSLEQLGSAPWRLFTPMLLHFGVLHLIFNLLWWQTLGGIIERFQSSTQLVWVTLFTAAISHLAQFLASGANFGGLSGVVYGLLGYLWLYGRVNPAAGYGIPRPVVIFMLVWLVVCWVGLADVVANEAHLAGLVSGCALGAVTGFWRRCGRP